MSFNEDLKMFEAKLETLEKSKAKVEAELEEKERLLNLSQKMRRAKSTGNIWLIIGVLLIIAEIILFFTVDAFDISDVIYMSAPLVIGIYRKAKGYSSYKKIKPMLEGVDIEKLPAEVDDLTTKLNDLTEELEEAESDWDVVTKYPGKDEDMETSDDASINIKLPEKEFSLKDVVGNYDNMIMFQKLSNRAVEEHDKRGKQLDDAEYDSDKAKTVSEYERLYKAWYENVKSFRKFHSFSGSDSDLMKKMIHNIGNVYPHNGVITVRDKLMGTLTHNVFEGTYGQLMLYAQFKTEEAFN